MLRLLNGEAARGRAAAELELRRTYGNSTGCVNAPLPAESQAAKRTHFLPAVSNGMRNCLLPNGARSVAEVTWRPVVLPSPQTSSTNSSGKVHSTSAV